MLHHLIVHYVILILNLLLYCSTIYHTLLILLRCDVAGARSRVQDEVLVGRFKHTEFGILWNLVLKPHVGVKKTAKKAKTM